MYKVAGYVFWYTLLVVSNTVRSSDDITEQNLAALLYTFASTEYPSPTVDLLDRQLPCHCSENHNSAFVVLLAPFNNDTQPEEKPLEEQPAAYGGKVKRWQCTDCLAHFATWKTLVTHQTALEGRNKCPGKDQEEPEEAQGSFTHLDQQSNLTGNQIDEEPKPIIDKTCACLECGRLCSNKHNLQQHQQTHTGEKPHSCNICHRLFTKTGNRNKHEQTAHNFFRPQVKKVRGPHKKNLEKVKGLP